MADRSEVVSIQQFCMHVEAVTESLGDRTGRRISNDMVALREKPNKSLSYNSAAGRIYGTDKYPVCVSGRSNWARLFGAKAEEDNEGDDDDDDIFKRLPKFPNDNQYRMVKECAVQDNDVLDMFEEGDDGYSDSDDDETRVDNPIHGKSTSFMLGARGNRMGAVYLHPGEWFIAFKDKHFTNHLP